MTTPTPAPTQPTRPQTPLDRIADDYLEASVALSPIGATYLGIGGHDHELDDFSPAGHRAASDLRARTLAALEGVEPVDDVDQVTAAAMRERLELAEATYQAGLDEMSLNVIDSPIQAIRSVFDLMPTATSDQWSTIVRRLRAVPTAVDQYVESLRLAASRRQVSPKRQVRSCMDQCGEYAASDGFFATFASGATMGDEPLDGELASDVQDAARGAAAAYEGLARMLEGELLEQAPESDACGRERYVLLSRLFLGTGVDLEETYVWGQEELARITADMQDVAERIRPGASIDEAIAALDADPSYELHSSEELREWMQRQADQAVTSLAGTHFDIPDPIRRIEAKIAPTSTGGIYYVGPSEDFTRPGSMWWAVPKGVDTFSTWRELTTVYHEGVPGHHLQVAQTVYRSSILNRWRRLMSWTSGHGEGWALYAERLMAELGYMDDPGNRLGWLDGQSLRAARVVIDIGVHCGFPAPAEVDGGEWTYDKAWTFLTRHARKEEGMLRFELDRYLGWPGQAPAYKIGERLWLQLRAEVEAREGEAFDAKAFHRRALDVGGVGLDVLRHAVLQDL